MRSSVSPKNVDALYLKLLDLRAQIEGLNLKKKEMESQIIQLVQASEDKIPRGKSFILRGEQFAIGYTKPAGRITLDQDAAQLYLPQPILKKCQIMVVDEGKLQEFVSKGQIAPSIIQKIYHESETSPRIYVGKAVDE